MERYKQRESGRALKKTYMATDREANVFFKHVPQFSKVAFEHFPAHVRFLCFLLKNIVPPCKIFAFLQALLFFQRKTTYFYLKIIFDYLPKIFPHQKKQKIIFALSR